MKIPSEIKRSWDRRFYRGDGRQLDGSLKYSFRWTDQRLCFWHSNELDFVDFVRGNLRRHDANGFVLIGPNKNQRQSQSKSQVHAGADTKRNRRRKIFSGGMAIFESYGKHRHIVSPQASGSMDYTWRERLLPNQRQARQEPRSPVETLGR